MDLTLTAKARNAAAASSIGDLEHAIEIAGECVKDEATGVLGVAESLRAAQRATASSVSALEDSETGGGRSSAQESRYFIESAQTELSGAASDAVVIAATAEFSAAMVDLANRTAVATAAVSDATRAAEAGATAALRRANGGRRTLVFFLIFAGVLGFVLFLFESEVYDSWHERAAAVITMAALLVGLVFVYARGFGSFAPLIVGLDGRYSTSKAQVFSWTVISVAIVGYLALLVGFGFVDAYEVGLTSDRVVDYLILLGGPVAAALLARFAVTTRIQSGSVQKTTAISASTGQLVQDDGGAPDLVDVQYVLFNLLAMGYVVVAFLNSGALPTVPAVLLALVGLSVGTYAVSKALFSNAPSITEVSPIAARPGQVVTVRGVNFTPDRGTGLDASRPAAVLSGVTAELAAIGEVSDGELSVQIPLGTSSGEATFQVRSTARALSEPYRITVVEDRPKLIGPLGVKLVAGGEVTLLGTHLTSPMSDLVSDNRVVVLFAERPVIGRASRFGTHERVSVGIPHELPEGEVLVRVRRGSVESDPVSLRILEG